MHYMYVAGLPMHPSEVTLPSRSHHLPVCTPGIEGDELTGVGIGRKEPPFGEDEDDARGVDLLVIEIPG